MQRIRTVLISLEYSSMSKNTRTVLISLEYESMFKKLKIQGWFHLSQVLEHVYTNKNGLISPNYSSMSINTRTV